MYNFTVGFVKRDIFNLQFQLHNIFLGRMLDIYKSQSFKKANKSPHKKYISYYTPELKNLITEAYIHDVKNLGYTFEH